MLAIQLITVLQLHAMNKVRCATLVKVAVLF